LREDFDDGLELVLVLRGELDGVGALELDLGLGVLEVEAGVDLFLGLVDGVFDFLKFHFADYVEAVVGCHDVFLLLLCLYFVEFYYVRRFGSVNELRGRDF
jgi:hypothetical protein